MSRPRVLVIAHSGDLYGADRTLLAAMPELIESFDVTIAFPSGGPLLAEASRLDVTTVLLPDYGLRRRFLRVGQLGGWGANVARAANQLRAEHRRAPFDLLYSNTLAATLGWVLRPMLQLPHVLHVHEAPRDRLALQRLLLGGASLATDLVICNSEYTRSLLVESEPRLGSRTRVIHNGLDIPGRTRPAIPSDKLRIAMVGRIHPKKGQRILIEAARRARKRGVSPRWELHLWGDSLPEHAPLHARLLADVASSGLSDDIVWHGFSTDTQAMYTDADIAVVPSVVPEEFSLVCLEAQAMGVPVVASGPGGPSEILAPGESGLIVPAMDPDALADAIATLGADPERRAAMAVVAVERAARFSRARYARGVVQACRDALELPVDG